MADNNRGRVPEDERCQGTSRQKGRPCRRRRSPGSAFCAFHGGRSRKGAAHPNFRDGKRSRYRPPPNLLENYGRFLRDPELAHHANSVAIIDSMLQELFDDYDPTPVPKLWRSLRAAWIRSETARASGDETARGAALEEVGLLLMRGAAQTERANRAVGLLEQRRRHADAELRREIAERHTFTVEQAAAFYVALGAAVKKNVPDREQLMRIENDLVALVGRVGPDRSDAPEEDP